jgi:hypothetical protein
MLKATASSNISNAKLLGYQHEQSKMAHAFEQAVNVASTKWEAAEMIIAALEKHGIRILNPPPGKPRADRGKTKLRKIAP